MHRRHGDVYFAIETSCVQSGEHQAVAHIGDGLILKTKLVDQVLEEQTSGDRTYIRLGAEQYRWENLAAEEALGEIGIDVPVVSSQYFRIAWMNYGEEKFPAVLPVEHPESRFIFTPQLDKESPTFVVSEDLSRGGKIEVREVFDPRNRQLENYTALESKLSDSVNTILQYCEAHCYELGIQKKAGYQASFSLHATPKGGYALYESEARSCFFVLVDKSNPGKGTLVIGDLDGLSLKREAKGA